ncbi:hypothetical protein [Alishewanella jeotgali]|uniref:Uncharacterized protein n=1 Tax=Alishewanella jeotgali KCTC 22429 TaxID=1129374 RepID=H3ZFY9_9ALTE|nr:hypothetical protein [Alishewanella jeotgali]EHR40497.1 hypothetical protein AJE_11429 [Alishewanella jeotgali KCTC 22429]
MKAACSVLLLLSLSASATQADLRLGKWCESDDGGQSCLGFISYFPNGDVYGYGVVEDVFYIATGDWQQRDQLSCLNLTYKLFNPLTETPYPPEEINFCNRIVDINPQTFVYLADDGERHTMYRISEQPDYSMLPQPAYLQQHSAKIQPELLTLSPAAGNYGLYPLMLETVPAEISFTMSITPHKVLDPRWFPYAYLQIGDPEDVNFRISLHQKPDSTEQNILMLEYRVGGHSTKQKLASHIANGEAVHIRLSWQPDGSTRIHYREQTVQYTLPLSSWQSYFVVSGTTASFQRQLQ